jgi:membrane associated rhomboid family serine protease
LFPLKDDNALVFVLFFIRIIRVPAVIVLGFWFIIQVLNGLGTLGGAKVQATWRGSPISGVSSWAPC